MQYLLTFDATTATQVDLSGGKGANLALLTRRGFPVPFGFIVTAKAYREFIQSDSGFAESVRSLPVNDPMALRRASEELRAMMGEWHLPTALAAEVASQMGNEPASQTFSVRSSSTLEDLASAAFAGQHETYLNCSGQEQILRRIKDCFISLWQAHAIAYRQQHGFDHFQAAMAVVVQKMVSCDVAGVGFSINPVSGDMSEMVVDANYGLGESVVSGEGEVDHFEIDKATRSVSRRVIAQKTGKVVGLRAGGTAMVAVSDEEASQACLSEQQLTQVAELLLKAEQSFRFPQDIEWGIADGEIYLLQSRPLTTLPPRWTRDESAERFPNVITPLTWDFVDNGFHRSLAYSFKIMGFPAYKGKWFGMFDHYIYGNQNVVDLYLKRPPFVVRSVDELRAVIPQLREQFHWVQELPIAWSRELDHFLTTIGGFMAEPVENKSLAEVWAHVLKVNEAGAEYFQPNIAISITHATLNHLLHRLAQLVCGERARGLLDRLLAHCETKTGTINKELYEMAQMVRTQPELANLLSRQTSREIIEQNELAHFPAFEKRFHKFLRDHGHREMEFDMYHPTWLEVPWVVLDNLRLMLQSPLQQTPAQHERELKVKAQQAEREFFQLLPPDLHFFFHEILRLTRLYTSLDDLEHYQTTRLALPVRRSLREIGQRLVARGVLVEPMDIFMARWEQVNRAVAEDSAEGWTELGRLVARQKAAYLSDKPRKPDWILGCTSAEDNGTATSLTGLPGSTGTAEGEVFVVLNEEDFARFPKGAVLVARTTNPTWTPLFYSAVAVITESGGPLSHGAVTAREMDIPAVMAVQNVLSKLKNGQRVKVDGAAGRVCLIKALLA